MSRLSQQLAQYETLGMECHYLCFETPEAEFAN